MAAGLADIKIEQGADFLAGAQFFDSSVPPQPVDITGWTFRGQVRDTYSTPAIEAAFVIAASGPAVSGAISIAMSSAATNAIIVPPADDYTRPDVLYAYDIEGVKPDGTVIRILQGIAYISPQVTQ